MTTNARRLLREPEIEVESPENESDAFKDVLSPDALDFLIELDALTA
jgi:hypothetical protein